MINHDFMTSHPIPNMENIAKGSEKARTLELQLCSSSSCLDKISTNGIHGEKIF